MVRTLNIYLFSVINGWENYTRFDGCGFKKYMHLPNWMDACVENGKKKIY